jgi:two-component system, NarL family, nitrate/nitrite response regulator NarL
LTVLLTKPANTTANAAFDCAAQVRWISSKPQRRENVVRIAAQGSASCRVFIVDRDSMSSDLLAGALVRDSGFEAAVVQAADLLSAIESAEIDLVVIAAELNLKSGNGFDLAQSVARAHPNVSIVMLLNRGTHDSVINAFRSGARGVFSRQQPMSEFLECVEQVSRGCIWAGAAETGFLLSAVKNIPSPTVVSAGDSSTLTAREMQVVQYAAVGKTNKVIASDLGLSEHTVKNYLFRAFEKLGVSSRIELLFYLTMRGHVVHGAKPEMAPALAPENAASGDELD